MHIKSKVTQTTLDKLDKIIGERLTFGNMICTIRECDDMTQAAFAKILGVSRQYLCDVEHDRKIVSAKTAYEYAEKLGYDAEQFVRLAIQSSLDNAGLEFDIEVQARRHKRTRKHQAISSICR